MEEDGAAWLNDKVTAGTPKRGGGAKPKPNTAGADAKNGVSDKDDRAIPATPKPKTNAAAKTTTKATGSATKRGRKAKDTEVDGDEATTEDATPSKKARFNSMATTEDNDGIEAEVKKETGSAGVANGELEDRGDRADNEFKSEKDHE